MKVIESHTFRIKQQISEVIARISHDHTAFRITFYGTISTCFGELMASGTYGGRRSPGHALSVMN